MQNNQENIQRYEEEEIDLRDLFRTLVKNKNMIAIMTLVITIGAIVYAFSVPKVYEGKAVIEVGSIKYNSNSNSNSNSELENSSNLVKRLEIEYLSKKKNNVTSVHKISLVKGTQGLVEISVYSDSNDNAKEALNKIISKIKDEHKVIINNYKTLIIKNIENLKSQKDELESGRIEFENSKQVEYELLSKINDLNLMISPINIKETKLFGNIILNDYAIKPNKKLIISVAFVTGLILSIFLVFFMEFIKGFREEKPE